MQYLIVLLLAVSASANYNYLPSTYGHHYGGYYGLGGLHGLGYGIGGYSYAPSFDGGYHIRFTMGTAATGLRGPLGTAFHLNENKAPTVQSEIPVVRPGVAYAEQKPAVTTLLNQTPQEQPSSFDADASGDGHRERERAESGKSLDDKYATSSKFDTYSGSENKETDFKAPDVSSQTELKPPFPSFKSILPGNAESSKVVPKIKIVKDSPAAQATGVFREIPDRPAAKVPQLGTKTPPRPLRGAAVFRRFAAPALPIYPPYGTPILPVFPHYGGAPVLPIFPPYGAELPAPLLLGGGHEVPLVGGLPEDLIVLGKKK